MSLRDCSDAELAFELALRSKLSSLASDARSFEDYLDGTFYLLSGDIWDDIQADVFAALDECSRQLFRIRKGISESADGAYDGPTYD